MNRRLFLQGLTGTALVAGGVAYGFDTHDLEVPSVPVRVGLSRPWRMAVLGDIHFDPLYEVDYLTAVMNQITALKVDLVAFTGDFISNEVSRMAMLARILAGAESKIGSFAVLGNHDHWRSPAIVMAHLQRQGIRMLENACFALPGESGVFLSGLQSFWAGRPRPEVIAQTPPDSRHIVLVHEPDPFTQLDDPRIRLQISGHTHGGQVRIPFVGAVIQPEWGKKFNAGLFAREDRFLYVNRGLGTLTPHIRFNCRPEVTLFELS